MTTTFPHDPDFPFVGINVYGSADHRFKNRQDADAWADRIPNRRVVDTRPVLIPCDVNFIAWNTGITGITHYARRNYIGTNPSGWFLDGGVFTTEAELLTRIGSNKIILLDER